MGRGKKKDLPKSICLLSALYDPVNYLTLDVQTGHFIVRMREHWLPVTEIRASRKRDTIVTLTVSDKYYDSFRQEFPTMKKEVKCRLVKIALENGEEEILGTSLLDTVKYKLPELGELYQFRWGTEEGYKMFKAQVQVEPFGGKTAVRQDIYAEVMMMTLCAALAFPIEEPVIAECNAEKQKGKVKHRRKIN